MEKLMVQKRAEYWVEYLDCRWETMSMEKLMVQKRVVHLVVSWDCRWEMMWMGKLTVQKREIVKVEKMAFRPEQLTASRKGVYWD